MIYALYLFLMTVLLLELALRIYNPFHFRLKGDHILLETNKTYLVENKDIPGIDRNILHRRNALGFRGPEKPGSFNRFLSLLTVGGSTTECPYISEGKTWSDLLYGKMKNDFDSVWLNNAGLAGHSTFGNLALMKDYVIPLKPSLVIFMEGANDVGRDDLTESDKANMPDRYHNIFTFLSKKTELGNLVSNLVKKRKAVIHQLADHYINLETADSLMLKEQSIREQLSLQLRFVQGFENRMNELISLSVKNGMLPILITQPSLFGPAVDSLTGRRLENVRITDHLNGELWWKELELYNDVTRKLASQHKLLLVDLAADMPKSSLYFYDLVHFTNKGSEFVSGLIYQRLKEYLASKYPTHQKK